MSEVAKVTIILSEKDGRANIEMDFDPAIISDEKQLNKISEQKQRLMIGQIKIAQIIKENI